MNLKQSRTGGSCILILMTIRAAVRLQLTFKVRGPAAARGCEQKSLSAPLGLRDVDKIFSADSPRCRAAVQQVL